MNCKNCKRQGCSFAGKSHEMSFECKMYVGKIKADLIRSMSDEELAEFLNNHNFCARNFDCEKGMRPCRECNLDWLRQEVEEDD